MTLPITPKHDWQFKTKCRIEVSDADTQQWALFIINNLTKQNVEVLKGYMPITIQIHGWLDEHTASLFAPIVEDRTKALLKAVENGACQSGKYPTLSYAREREVVGAAICELVEQGFANGLKSSLSPTLNL